MKRPARFLICPRTFSCSLEPFTPPQRAIFKARRCADGLRGELNRNE